MTLTTEEKNQIINLLRKETGLGCLELSRALSTFIETLNRRPNPVCDVGYRIKMEWETYSLR